ncbi:hypothetical protein SAMN05519103_09670 [Rhizobiales bacterium GAS113]|nr:hypothetical protein SAMN05519103_09670 [Rhizobiales bacterium GAS113]
MTGRRPVRRGQVITAAQCRAARALIDMSEAELSGSAVVPRGVIQDFEAVVTPPRPADLEAIQRALEAAGVEFIAENGGGPGVRLRKGGK